MEFTAVDGGVAAITLISGILAYSRGLTREVFALAGWVLAFIAAYFLAPVVDPIIREAPVVGPFLAQSCILSLIAAFTIVVAGALLVLSVFTPLLSNLILDSALGALDRMLGFVFGIARGVLLVAVAYLIYVNFAGPGAWPMLEKAASRQLLDETAKVLTESLPESVPTWFGERVDELMVNCEARPVPATPGGATVPVTPGGATPPAAPGDGTAPSGTEPTGAGSAGSGN